MEYEIRELPSYRILGLAGRIREIGQIWEGLGPGFRDGRLRSSYPDIEAMAAVLHDDDGIHYVAGVPMRGTQIPRGFVSTDVPGGRYAITNHRGEHSEMPELMRALDHAATDAGERPTGVQVELYYRDSSTGKSIELGVQLER